jgi:predicted ATP-grasp superfamily ATP-dependent carboligase
VRQFVGEPWLGAREFQYCGAVGPWPVTEAALRQIRRIGDVLAACFGLRGLFGVDFVLEDDRVWTIEVNPRYPASAEILERATGIRLIASHAVACQASRFAVALPHEATALHGKAIVFARRAVTVANELRNESQEAQPINRWPAFGDVPRVGTGIEPGRPILTVFADGATPDEVVANLQARVAIVERQLYA